MMKHSRSIALDPRRAMRRASSLLALGVLATAANAQGVFDLSLDGSQEVPPNASTATGTATVNVNVATGNVSISGTFNGLSGNINGAHLHAAPVGVNGPIILPLTPTGMTSGTFSGSAVLSAAEVEEVLCGLTYVNVHSTVFPGGEIRGQVVAVPATSLYGSGVNPAGSLTVVAGVPQIGSVLTLGVDNPVGSQGTGGAAALVVSLGADPLFVCCGAGLLLPGFGMSGPSGELLVDLALFVPTTLVGGPWTGPGNPVPIDVPIPNNKSLSGVTIFVQGILTDPSGTGPAFALTEGAELYFGP